MYIYTHALSATHFLFNLHFFISLIAYIHSRNKQINFIHFHFSIFISAFYLKLIFLCTEFLKLKYNAITNCAYLLGIAILLAAAAIIIINKKGRSGTRSGKEDVEYQDNQTSSISNKININIKKKDRKGRKGRKVRKGRKGRKGSEGGC